MSEKRGSWGRSRALVGRQLRSAGLVCSVILVASLVSACGAGAATITHTGSTLNYLAAPGETNDVEIASTVFGYRFTEVGGTPLADVPAECTIDPPGTVTCPLALDISSIEVSAADGNDVVDASGVVDGAGFPLLASLRIHGGSGSDTLTGGEGADEILAGDGASDTIDCGPGSDSLEADALPLDPAIGCEQINRSSVSVSSSGGVLTISGAGNDAATDMDTRLTVTGPDYRVADEAVWGVIAGVGCTQVSEHQVDCPSAGVTQAIVTLGEGDDRFDASSDVVIASSVSGGDGDDVITGGAGPDEIHGGDGDDRLVGNAGTDAITGGANADEIIGGDGADTLTGDAGSDQIEAVDAFDDTIDCGPDSDVLEGDALPFDPEVGCEQVDRSSALVSSSGGVITISVPADKALNMRLDGSSTLTVTDDTLGSVAGGDGCMRVSQHQASCPLAGVTQMVATLGGLGDRFDASNLALIVPPLTVSGGGGDDNLFGGNGVETFHGDDGNDLLAGGNGDDQIFGDSGDDLILNTGVDNTNLGPNDDVHGGAGFDIWSNPDGLVNASLDGLRNDGDGNQDMIFDDIEGLSGSNRQDHLVGNDGPNLLIGGDDHDWLEGKGGNDVLTDPSFPAGQPTDGLNIFDGGTGDDLLLGGSSDDLLEGGDGTDTIAGAAGNDTVNGDSGNGDQLSGGPGADTLRGGDGSGDAVVDYVNAAGPVAVSLDGSPNDGPAEQHDDVRDDVEVIFGGPFDDVLVGDGGAQTLDGGAGDDSLDGGGGRDMLFGRAGEDVVSGGPGNDVLDGGADDDMFEGGTGADWIGDEGANAGGTDVADYSGRVEAVHVSLDGQVNDGANGGGEGDNVLPSVENILGGQGDDVVEGSGVANVFTAGTGNDTLLGGGGSDSLVGNDGKDALDGGSGPDSLSGGAGEDRASYAGRGAGVHASLDDAANDGEPGEGDNVASDIEQVQGGSGSDTLVGNSAVNTLLGEGGDDKLFGGDNFDLLLGGSGNDELRGEAGPDTLKAGDGNDTADGGEGEDLVLGEGDDDSVVGGGGIDNLNAGAGADAILSKDGVVDIVSCGTDTDPDKLDADPNDAVSDDCAIPAAETSFVSLSITSARASRSGVFTVGLTCRRIQQACAGTLSLETASKVKAKKRGKKRKLALGSTKFNIAPSKSAKLTIKLGKTAQSALKRLKRFSVRASASGPSAKTLQQSFTLSAPKAKKKKGKR